MVGQGLYVWPCAVASINTAPLRRISINFIARRWPGGDRPPATKPASTEVVRRRFDEIVSRYLIYIFTYVGAGV